MKDTRSSTIQTLSDNNSIDRELLLLKQRNQQFPFHIVLPSPWPFAMSISLLYMAIGGVLFLQNFSFGIYFVLTSTILVSMSFFFWFRDVNIESDYLGNHTFSVQKGLTLGLALFITTEVLFFFGIFWAYFHSSLSPLIELGSVWPPTNIEPINAYELPLLNTIILLSSGAYVTYSHHCLLNGQRNGAINGLIITLILAVLFTLCQFIEYTTAPFTISDSVFGSCFYFATGFHSFHVIVGTIFLYVGYKRLINYKLTNNHHIGYESGILYWHFVDVVWLFVLTSIYFWGS